MVPEGLILREQPPGATADKAGEGTVPRSRTMPGPTTDFSTVFFPSPRGLIFLLVKGTASWLWGLRVSTYLRLESVWLLQRARISTATPMLLMELLCRLQTQDKVLLVWLSWDLEGAD